MDVGSAVTMAVPANEPGIARAIIVKFRAQKIVVARLFHRRSNICYHRAEVINAKQNIHNGLCRQPRHCRDADMFNTPYATLRKISAKPRCLGLK